MVSIAPTPRDPSARVGKQVSSEAARHHFGTPPKKQQRMAQP